MFTTLIASDSKKKGKTMTPGGMFLSVVIHGLLLVGAVYASVQPPPVERKVEEQVTFLEMEDEAEPEPPPPPLEQPAVAAPAAPIVVGFQELIPPMDPPPVIPMADMSAPAVNIADFSGIGVAGGVAPPEGYVPPPTPPEPGEAEAGFAYEVAVLDSPPVLQNTAAVQAAMLREYPQILLDAGISGRVTAEFVVEADGTVDMSTLKITNSTHDRFVQPSTNVIQRFRYTPGRYKGQPVRVLVSMPISWQAASVR